MSDEATEGGARTPLIAPPTLRTEEGRSASRLELFFDLAYVLVVAELATAFALDLTWHGAFVFAGLFAITWWSWVTITLYANRFDTNDVIFRLVKLAGTFAVVVTAASAPTAIGLDAAIFTLGYLASRVLLFGLYARAWRHVPEARTTIGIYLAGSGAGAGVWALSLLVPAPLKYGLWAAGVLVEAAAPVLATRFGRDVPLHLEHLPERFGLFVILVLGESVASVVTGLHDTHFRLVSVGVAALGFLLTAALWWSYFDLGGAAGKHRLEEDEDDSERSWMPDAYVYGHLPLVVGLGAVGVGIEQFIAHPTEGLSPGGRWALCAGASLFVLGTALVLAGTSRSWRAAWPWPALAIPLMLALGWLDELGPVLLIALLARLVVLVVVTGIIKQRRGELETVET